MYPATFDSEKISFNQINKKTGHRIKYVKVDANTGEEVSNDEITKGFKVDTDTYIEVSKEELDNIALESTGTIDINGITKIVLKDVNWPVTLMPRPTFTLRLIPSKRIISRFTIDGASN